MFRNRRSGYRDQTCFFHADTQADLNLRLTHTSEGTFAHVAVSFSCVPVCGEIRKTYIWLPFSLRKHTYSNM